MNRNDVVAGIAKAWQIASALQLGEVFSNPAPLEVSGEFRGLALSDDVLYEELYLSGLRNSEYNFTLIDYSFFQFGSEGENRVRYAYYPNPFLGSSQDVLSDIEELREFVAEGIITVEEFLHKISEERRTQHPPLTRYENAPDQYVELIHPCSHFHLGHHRENRWPVRRVLSPSAFSLIVFKQYYKDVWFGSGEVSLFGTRTTLDDLLIRERMNCRVLGEELFSEAESRSFHLI